MECWETGSSLNVTPDPPCSTAVLEVGGGHQGKSAATSQYGSIAQNQEGCNLPISPAAQYTWNSTCAQESWERCKLPLGCQAHQGRSLATELCGKGGLYHSVSGCPALILSILQELGVQQQPPLASCHHPLHISFLRDTGVKNEIYQTDIFHLTP